MGTVPENRAVQKPGSGIYHRGTELDLSCFGTIYQKKPFEMAHNNSKAIFQNRISTWDSLD
jgi:hypothetical protein